MKYKIKDYTYNPNWRGKVVEVTFVEHAVMVGIIHWRNN